MLPVVTWLAAAIVACEEPSTPPAEPRQVVIVARCATALDPTAANQELFELRSLLDRWLEQEAWPSLEGDPCPALSSRLVLFEQRFGVSPHELPGWNELAATARRAAELVEAFAETRLDDGWSWWSGTRWLGARAMLLEIAGRSAESHELLFDTEVKMQLCCEYHRLEEEFNLARYRAENLDRAGARMEARQLYSEALECLGDARLEAALGHERPAYDLMLACYAMLLSRDGSDADVVTVLEELHRQGPGTFGATVVDAELEVIRLSPSSPPPP